MLLSQQILLQKGELCLENSRSAKVYSMASKDLYDRIRSSGDCSILSGYMIHSHRLPPGNLMHNFRHLSLENWENSGLFQLWWFFVHPVMMVVYWPCFERVCTAMVRSYLHKKIAFPDCGDSIDGQCHVICAVPDTTNSNVVPISLKTPHRFHHHRLVLLYAPPSMRPLRLCLLKGMIKPLAHPSLMMKCYDDCIWAQSRWNCDSVRSFTCRQTLPSRTIGKSIVNTVVHCVNPLWSFKTTWLSIVSLWDRALIASRSYELSTPLRNAIFICFHTYLNHGHLNAHQTHSRLHMRFYWPRMFTHCARCYRQCPVVRLQT